MSTTIRIREEDKDRLRRLQEAWRRVRGQAPAQQELLGKGLEYLEEKTDDFIKRAAWQPLTEKEIRSLEGRAQHLGNWSVASLDDIVYGEGE